MTGGFENQLLAEFSPAVPGTIVKDQVTGTFIGSTTTGTDATASGTITSSADEMLILGCCHDFSSISFTVGTGYTLAHNNPGFTTLEYKTANAGSQNGTFTASSGGAKAYVNVVSFGQQTTAIFSMAGDNDDGTGYRESAGWATISSGSFTAEATTDL
jgi:hypothetical protein